MDAEIAISNLNDKIIAHKIIDIANGANPQRLKKLNEEWAKR